MGLHRGELMEAGELGRLITQRQGDAKRRLVAEREGALSGTGVPHQAGGSLPRVESVTAALA
ncbi:hypothetical protein NS365_16115 [Aureimonas ureilytica]|uniref:Uncharacterized protein n=2 Tax=Aureimonas ureilytica TaxID=401562 RepID=A0A175RLK4_9HYPH|nr:hypothetical protein NS365_16115 [Aureimonas ureilytica]